MKILALLVGVVVGFWFIGQIFERRKTNPGPSSTEETGGPDDSRPYAGAPQDHDLMAKACNVLELDSPFTQQELRTAYRRQMSQYHPDKVSGLGRELREVADRKTKEINAAFDFLQGHTN